MADSVYGVRVATSKSGSAYIAGLYGPNGVARKLKEMGLERNEFQKWVKQAALIVAQRATHLAPRQSGRLALSIRGYAGKKITPNNAPARYLFGGVVIAQPKQRGATDSYGKSVSFGRYYPATGVRTKSNPYIRTARDQTRSAVVRMWNKEIGRWIEKNGFDATGFGGA
jgi:hypothetical protein